MGLGLLTVKFLKFPAWVTPAIAFNNTTSLPLLLTESLSSTGILDGLLLDGDSTEDAINRAQSYFLVCAIVGNCLTFAIGPRLIDAENAPGDKEERDDDCDEENGSPHPAQGQGGHDTERVSINDDELTSLLPHRVRNAGGKAHKRVFFIGRQNWKKLSPRAQDVLIFLFDFLNAPLLGAVLGAIIGLTPSLHCAFFNDSNDGGFLNGWLTSSLKKIGELFVTLQVVVVGVSLSSSLRKMKRGEDKGLPLLPTVFVLVVRLVLWPVISIAVIWVLATKTNTLQQDPILWFTMMLMPTGPPAMKLIAMAEVNGAGEDDKMVISKVLTVSTFTPAKVIWMISVHKEFRTADIVAILLQLAYACSPLLALTVVGSLYSSEAAIRS